MNRVFLSLVMLLPGSLHAQCYTPTKVTYGTHYVSPSYKTVSYDHKVYDYKQEVVLVPKAIAVEVNRDFYFSLSDYYRDSLLADAIAARIMSKTMSASPPQANPMFNPVGNYGSMAAAPYNQQMARPAVPAVAQPARYVGLPGTDAYPQLWNSVRESCLGCHNNNKPDGNLSLESADGKLALLPEGVAWKTHGLVRIGLMPKNQNALPNDIVDAWAKYALDAKGR